MASCRLHEKLLPNMEHLTNFMERTNWSTECMNWARVQYWSVVQSSTFKVQITLDNLEGHQVVYLDFGDADKNCPVHEMEGEESQGEGDSWIPLNVTCPHSKQSCWWFSNIEWEGQGWCWHSLAAGKGRPSRGQCWPSWRESWPSGGKRGKVLRQLGWETGHLLPLLHLQRAEVGVAVPDVIVLDPHQLVIPLPLFGKICAKVLHLLFELSETSSVQVDPFCCVTHSGVPFTKFRPIPGNGEKMYINFSSNKESVGREVLLTQGVLQTP